MRFANKLSSGFKARKSTYSSLVIALAVVAGCSNTKPVDIANIPTPEAASNHRVALTELTNDTQEVVAETQIQTLAHLPAETSNVTKFSSKTFGVKGSPRVTTTRGVRKGGGRYQIGKPYTIRGIKYYPKLDPNLRQTGLASWYGPNFHGRLTANGEVYDQYGLSAAHPTMPLPSYAKVTNLENGSSVTVRVNDRGPFSKNRVIDLSARAAQLLGYTKQGVAKVKVEYAGKAPLHGLDEKTLMASYSPGRVDQNSIPALPGRDVVLAQAQTQTTAQPIKITAPVPTARTQNTNVPRPAGLINSYADKNNSNNAVRAFDKVLGHHKLNEPQKGMRNLVRLEFGPFLENETYDEAEKLFAENGISQRISIDGHQGDILLLIVAEEETSKILEVAKSAGISLNSQK